MATPQLYKSTGIILRRTNSGEGDKIITVLCERFGKKRFVGKGIRKIGSRRSGHIELFSKTNFILHRGKSLDYITGATVVRAYGSSYTTLMHIAAAYTACEVLDRLVPDGEEHDEAFYLLDSFLSSLGNADSGDIPLLTKHFVDSTLKILGYKVKDSESSSLGHAIAGVEHVIERKIRSIHLFSKSGVDIFKTRLV